MIWSKDILCFFARRWLQSLMPAQTPPPSASAPSYKYLFVMLLLFACRRFSISHLMGVRCRYHVDGLHVSPAITLKLVEALHKAGVLEGGPPSSQALLEFRVLYNYEKRGYFEHFLVWLQKYLRALRWCR